MLDLFKPDWKELWGNNIQQDTVGAVFTRPEIVRLILDLTGYTTGGTRLATRRVLEPSCGDGAFLAEVVDRLISSELDSDPAWDDPELDDALRAADIDEASLVFAREMITDKLISGGCPPMRASDLANNWIVHTDFLLSEWPYQFDLVVGNPPYVRIEDLPKRVLSRYRNLFSTASDRADLYIAFFEKGLSLLSEGGVLAFICANRFAKNKYGGKLRKLIAESYHVRYYLNLEHTQPFIQDVSAYPAILVIDRNKGASTQAATVTDIDPATLEVVRDETLKAKQPRQVMSEFAHWYPGGEPWTSTSGDLRRVLSALQEIHPMLENSGAGTRVGIGVATGADKVFVMPEKSHAIEESRQIPLLMSCHISVEKIEWDGNYLVNPFDDSDTGSLIDLACYPMLEAYFERHEDQLRGRHVARKRPQSWYRTIDRIWPSLQFQPKLVIPDIQSGGVIGFDSGQFYPHHNVYWITSESWDLNALRTLLRSSIVLSQIEAFSVQMRGGSLRYQAQTLRQVRVPLLSKLPPSLLDELIAVSASKDQAAIDAIAAEAFSLR